MGGIALRAEGFPSRISWEPISCQKAEFGDLGSAFTKAPAAACLNPDVWQPQFACRAILLGFLSPWL